MLSADFVIADGDRLCRAAVPPRLRLGSARKARQCRLPALAIRLHAADLRLLHELDLLWRRRHGGAQRAGVHRHLSWADAGFRRLVVHPAQAGPHQPQPAHHLGRRPPVLAFRQVEPAGGAGDADRHHQHDALHRAAAQGDHLVDPGGRGGQRTGRRAALAASTTSAWPSASPPAWRCSRCCSARATSTPRSSITASWRPSPSRPWSSSRRLLAVGLFVVFGPSGGLEAIFSRARERGDRNLSTGNCSASRWIAMNLPVRRGRSSACRDSSRLRWSRIPTRTSAHRRLGLPGLPAADEPVHPADRALWADDDAGGLQPRHVRADPADGGRQDALALFAFIGGFSSATSMIIVASIALSIMVSNHIVHADRAALSIAAGGLRDERGVSRLLLQLARFSIALILLLGFLYFCLTRRLRRAGADRADLVLRRRPVPACHHRRAVLEGSLAQGRDRRRSRSVSSSGPGRFSCRSFESHHRRRRSD